MTASSMIRYRRDLWKVITVPGNSAEIGVAEGLFSNDILEWRIQFPHHYMVDRWAHFPIKGDSSQPQEWHDANLQAAKERVRKHGDRPIFLRGDSAEMANHVPDNSLAFLYIDGDHSYEGVMRDILCWIPKVKTGGIVAFHDFEAPEYGVKRAVTSFCHRHNKHIYGIPEDKLEDAGAYFIN